METALLDHVTEMGHAVHVHLDIMVLNVRKHVLETVYIFPVFNMVAAVHTGVRMMKTVTLVKMGFMERNVPIRAQQTAKMDNVHGI